MARNNIILNEDFNMAEYARRIHGPPMSRHISQIPEFKLHLNRNGFRSFADWERFQNRNRDPDFEFIDLKRRALSLRYKR